MDNNVIVDRKKGLTTFDLKIIGILLMFVDHIHEMFAIMGAPDWLDYFGRPVATLFFFISAEGFSHTRNREKYLRRLLFGFWLMNGGNFLVQRFFSLGQMALINNIFSDLFVAVLTMYGIEKIRQGHKEGKFSQTILGAGCIVFPIAVGATIFSLMLNPETVMPAILLGNIVPNLFFTENSIMVYLAVVFYLFRDRRMFQYLAIAIVSLIYLSTNISGMFTTNTQWMMVFSIGLIALYNGDKGKGLKEFFYVFYPAHIWMLYIIASIIFNHFY